MPRVRPLYPILFSSEEKKFIFLLTPLNKILQFLHYKEIFSLLIQPTQVIKKTFCSTTKVRRPKYQEQIVQFHVYTFNSCTICLEMKNILQNVALMKTIKTICSL